MNKRRVVVTGTGVITALADSRQSLHEALCTGMCGLKQVELFDDPLLNSKPIVGEITNFAPSAYLGEHNYRPLDRTSQLLISATQLALCDSSWTTDMLEKDRVGLVVGTTFCSLRTISAFDRRALEEGPSCASPLDFANTVINAASGQTAIWHKLRGVNSTISSGITSSLEAIAYAAELIRSGHENAILAGGVEDICVESLLAFQRAGLLMEADEDCLDFRALFARRRHGFALAEGAALLMLEEFDSAIARGAHILAEVKGARSCFDCSTALDNSEPAMVQRSACIVSAIESALEDSELCPNKVESISFGANGNCFCDRAETTAYESVFAKDYPSKPVTAIKSMLGENMGASAAIQSIEAISTLIDGRISGVPGFVALDCDLPLGSITSCSRKVDAKNCLISSVGIDGHCSALVMSIQT